MWIETGELVKLVEQLDKAEAQLNAYFGTGIEAGSDGQIVKCGTVLRELRRLLYADLAAADGAQDAYPSKQRTGL